MNTSRTIGTTRTCRICQEKYTVRTANQRICGSHACTYAAEGKHLPRDVDAINQRVMEMARQSGSPLTDAEMRAICAAADRMTGPEGW